MYKVILVDDEILTREAICDNTPWEEAKLTLVGSAENGKAAIELIEREHPNLVITDICMPVMDGLELAEYINKHYPEIGIMIISGYNEFEYAKRALTYGVIDYVLKPFTPEELLEQLKKASAKLIETTEKEERIEALEDEQKKNRSKLQNLFVKDLLEGKATSKNLVTQMEHFGIGTIGKYQAVVFAGINDATHFSGREYAGNDELLNFAIANIIGELIQNHEGILQFIGTDEQSVYVFSADTKDELNKKIKEMGGTIVSSISQYLKVDACMIVGETVDDIRDWSRSYNSGKEAAKNRFSEKKGSFIYATDISHKEDTTNNSEILLTGYAETIVDSLKKGDNKKLHDTCHELFEDLRGAHAERNDILFRIQNIAFALLMQLKTILDPGQQLAAQNHDFFQNMQHCRHISALEIQMKEFLDFLAEQVTGGFVSGNQKLAMQAEDYIEKNCNREDLSLNDVCAFLGVSPSYFSVVYKNETGETFVETMTRVRMERAKVLLLDATRKNYEIAEMVGFVDPHYFGSVFKKYTGMTPSEYGKKFRGEKG